MGLTLLGPAAPPRRGARGGDPTVWGAVRTAASPGARVCAQGLATESLRAGLGDRRWLRAGLGEREALRGVWGCVGGVGVWMAVGVGLPASGRLGPGLSGGQSALNEMTLS